MYKRWVEKETWEVTAGVRRVWRQHPVPGQRTTPCFSVSDDSDKYASVQHLTRLENGAKLVFHHLTTPTDSTPQRNETQRPHRPTLISREPTCRPWQNK